MTNCRTGDLARIVGGVMNADKIVLCRYRAWRGDKIDGVTVDQDDWWVIDRPLDLATTDGKLVKVRAVRDVYLRPMRGGMGEDEMIRIAGKPRKEGAK